MENGETTSSSGSSSDDLKTTVGKVSVPVINGNITVGGDKNSIQKQYR